MPYVRAIRWASDRLGDSGIIGFVTNAGFVEANTADGLRQCLADEFSSLYIFHLRGNQRTSGETSRKEGGKIFGSGSRAPIAISLLVKNPEVSQHGAIHFHDIGDYLSREDKLQRISELGSVAGISAEQGWQVITPDEHGDWLKQRDNSVDSFIALGDKRDDSSITLFANYSAGVKTQRDAWCYNASKRQLADNMARMIGFYNAEVQRFNQGREDLSKQAREAVLDSVINTDPSKISWTHNLKQELASNLQQTFEHGALVTGVYRPFLKQWMYYNRRLNERVYQMPRIFPDDAAENRLIMIKQRWSGQGQLALMVNCIPELQTDGGTQCFPLYLYGDAPEASEQPQQTGLFDAPSSPERQRRDAITDAGLAHFLAAYPGEQISKEDLFYYVYGLLHSPDYRERYADNLAKELPRIPAVKTAADFWHFSRAGRALAELHLNYETQPMYPATIEGNPKTADDYRVEKMKYGKKGKDKDLTVLHYNARITVRGIPLQAYDYVVNGKPALDWVVERQCVKTDKASGMLNDANDWATETMDNPRYPLELFLRVITVSLETNRIVANLPVLDID